VDKNPVWVTGKPEHDPADCEQGNHLWMASFFWSGRLAYWRCAGCCLTDRGTDDLPERVARINGWIESPPCLIFRGAHPPTSAARWATDRETVLVEGDPSSIHFVGEPIPGLPEAHSYEERDADGIVQEAHMPSRERHSPYGDHYTLVRYQVVNDELVRFESYCYEESTFDIPNAHDPRTRVVLSGLKPLP
jgi:hypothetical protein